MVGALAALAGPPLAPAKTLTVCKHGCVYTRIQSAVDHSGRGATIDVKPGTYVEGVIVSGHAHDGLRIVGLGKKPAAVLLEGRNAHGPGGAAQNGIEGDNVNNLDLENMKAEHYAANGFFINGCRGYLMKNLIAAFNRAYGLYVFRCVGGRMTQSVEPYQPASDGVIEHNLIYWNNFDYFRPGSPVTTNNLGVKGQGLNFPVGAGVVLFGVRRWTVKSNSIFGNFLWGAAAFSDPTNDTGKAINDDNRFADNRMGAAFHDANGTDFFNDGSGSGTCFEGNGAVTVDASITDPNLYPRCPSTAGSGTFTGDANQARKLLAIAGAKPPTDQESYWHVHPHPARKGRKPYEG